MFDGLAATDRAVLAVLLLFGIYLLLRQALTIVRERARSVKVGPDGLEIRGYPSDEAMTVLGAMQSHAHEHMDVPAKPGVVRDR